MDKARWSALVLGGGCLAGLCLLSPEKTTATLYGRVRSGDGPVAGARIRIQGHSATAYSDVHGRFRLNCPSDETRPVVAWKPGFRIAAASARLPLNLFLTPLPAEDNDGYSWIDPAPDPARSYNCANCHDAIYQEWRGSAHARSATNPRLLSLYDGRNDRGRPYRSWNLQHEHLLGAAVCASCHAPTFSDSSLEYDLSRVQGVAAQGVHCDYCHKVVDAPDDRLGTRFGRDGLRLLRPANDDQLFFGPLDDAVRPGESFGHLPLYRDSRYCASCHEGVVFGVHVYGTYSEWLESPARARGQQCQACHMTPTGTFTNMAPGKGGIARRPDTLASHTFPGGQADMLRRCLKLAVTLTENDDGVRAAVTVQAEGVGHRVPTGFIDRNLVLVLEARTFQGELVPLRQGPRLPPAAGPALAGLGGVLFAKQLFAIGGETPIPFWLPNEKILDTRLHPARPEQLSFRFPRGVVTLQARLLYRRFWPIVADARGWRDNEVLVCEQVAKLPKVGGTP
jgi:hypothetical protein